MVEFPVRKFPVSCSVLLRPSLNPMYTPRDLVHKSDLYHTQRDPSAPTSVSKQLGTRKASNQQALVSVPSTVVWREVEVVALRLTDTETAAGCGRHPGGW